MKWLPYLVVACIVSGCMRTDNRPADGMMAYVPVYATAAQIKSFGIEDAKPTKRPGKIYVYQQYIFQNELNEGIHVVDNTDPQHPVKKAFLTLSFNTDIAIRGNYIYANSLDDLVVIDISDPLHPQLVNRSVGAFPLVSQSHPPEQGYFVCPDPLKGKVVDWKLETVNSPACRR